MRNFLLSCFAFGMAAAAAHADDYKEATDAAYCAGAIKANISLTRRDFGGGLDVRADEENLHIKNAFVLGAHRQHKIDTETIAAMTTAGFNDAELCWNVVAKCSAEAAKRAEQNVDVVRSKTIMDNCMRPAQPACERIEKCK